MALNIPITPVTSWDQDWNYLEPGKYNFDCSCCYLGHSHTAREHYENIALHEVWGKQRGPWISPRSEQVQCAVKQWIADNVRLDTPVLEVCNEN